MVANSVYMKISYCPSRVSLAQRSEHRYIASETFGSIPGWDSQIFRIYNYDRFFCPLGPGGPGEVNVVVVNISKCWLYVFIDHIFILLARSSLNELHLCNSARSEDVAGMFL